MPEISPTLPSFKGLLDWVDSLETYHKIGLFALLSLYGPSPASWGWAPDKEALGIYPQIAYTGFSLLFLFATSSNLIGPICYALRPDGILSKLKRIPSWIYFVFVFLPAFRIWASAVVPFLWQYIRSEHTEAVRELTGQADDLYSVSLLEAKQALEDSAAAGKCELQGNEIAASALRDKRLALSLKSTDFFEESNKAWSMIHSITVATHNAITAATVVSDGATDIVQDVGREDTRTRDLEQKAQIAWNSALEANEAAENAAKEVQRFKDANMKHNDMRDGEVKSAKRAIEVLNNLSTEASNASAAARSAGKKTETVRQNCEAAKRLSIDGRMNDAFLKLKDAERMKVEVEKEAVKAATAARKAKDYLKRVAGS